MQEILYEIMYDPQPVPQFFMPFAAHAIQCAMRSQNSYQFFGSLHFFHPGDAAVFI
jgi:hypothetical protein